MTPPKFQALLFDFNGLILDDEPIHLELFQKVLMDEEINLTEKDYWEIYLGFDDKGLFKAIFEKEGKNLTPKKLKTLIQKKAALYLPTLQGKLRFFPGVIDFIHEAKTRHNMAVVSGALRDEIEFVLKAGKINSAFPIIISAEDTKHGKPNPEGYLLGFTKLKKLNSAIRPENCLVFEDSLAGIEAAHRAQMKCVALTHSYSKEELKEADYIVDTFDEIIDKIL